MRTGAWGENKNVFASLFKFAEFILWVIITRTGDVTSRRCLQSHYHVKIPLKIAPSTHLLFVSLLWFTALAFVCSRFWWSVRCDMSPSTVTFVYWFVTGTVCGLLLLLRSPLDDDDEDKLNKFLQNSFAADSFFTFTPSLLFVSWSHDPFASIFFMIIFITIFGFTFTSLGSWGLVASLCLSINSWNFLWSKLSNFDLILNLSRKKIYCRGENKFLRLFFTTVHIHARKCNENWATLMVRTQCFFGIIFSHSLRAHTTRCLFFFFFFFTFGGVF